MTTSRRAARCGRFCRFYMTSVAFLALGAAVQAAEFKAVINLSSLDGKTGFRLDGNAGERSGVSISKAGDVNGDGFDEVIVGAAGGKSFCSGQGTSYIVFGRAGAFPATAKLADLNGANGFRLDGISAGDCAGSSVSDAGDINSDGFEDIIIGAPGINSSFVVLGKPRKFDASLSLGSLNGSNGFRLGGVSHRLGYSVSGAGDVNGDGFDDILMSAPFAYYHNAKSGSAYVVFGKTSGFGTMVDLHILDGSNGFRLDGGPSRNYIGTTLSAAGDINGDGFGDLIFGIDELDTYNGTSFVFFGKAKGFPASKTIGGLDDGSSGFRGFYAGSVSDAGDVNGDGFGDFIFGHSYGYFSSIKGSSYIVFGKAAGFPSELSSADLNGTKGFSVVGVSLEDRAGIVSGAGDVNGDGFDDIIIGASGTDHNGNQSGSSYVVFGMNGGFPASMNLGSLDGISGFRLDGATAEENSGQAVSSAGDVNDDGFDDIIIGAPQSGRNGTDSGSAYVFFGRAPSEAVIRSGAAGDQEIKGGPFADKLSGLGGDDRLEGRQGPDILKGGEGVDTATYGHSAAGVTANLANPAANTTDAVGDSYDSIENLTGSKFDDTLVGDGNSNVIIGAGGKDRMRGGGGPDFFVFRSTSDSKPGAQSDEIVDFNAGTATTAIDRINLRQIDADLRAAGGQEFSFIGTKAFSGVRGQLRVSLSGTSTLIRADVNGDKIPDFEITLLNFNSIANLDAGDFRL